MERPEVIDRHRFQRGFQRDLLYRHVTVGLSIYDGLISYYSANYPASGQPPLSTKDCSCDNLGVACMLRTSIRGINCRRIGLFCRCC
jgi:hypothetical protein